MSIDVEQMRESLMTLDQVRDKLEPTEHLSEIEFITDGKSNVKFNYPDDWATNIGKDSDGLTPTSVEISVDGISRTLTKDAALEAASLFGLQKSYTLATPGSLITQHMNYWYNNTDRQMKLLAGPERGIGFTRASITPYSNIELLDSVVAAINERYRTTDLLVDYKFNHDLVGTDIRLIIPEASRYIQSARSSAAEPDQWSIGISLHNSITGASSLELSSYAFSWICTNGLINEHISSGKYRRKPTVPTQEVYQWAKDSVDDVLSGMELELEKIAHLTTISLEGELSDTLDQMLKEFKVPTTVREDVVNNLVESDDLSAFGLLNAVTAVANAPGLSAKHVDNILRAGGRIPDALSARCPSCHRI